MSLKPDKKSDLNKDWMKKRRDTGQMSLGVKHGLDRTIPLSGNRSMVLKRTGVFNLTIA